MSCHRPVLPPATIHRAAGPEAPLVALFEDEDAAARARAETVGRLLGSPSGGVLTFAAAPGLREDLYAAGALLVMG